MLILTVCQNSCPQDYILDKPTNMCFKLFKEEKMNWEEAKKSCVDNGRGRHLATVDTEERRKLMAEYIEELNIDFGGE